MNQSVPHLDRAAWTNKLSVSSVDPAGSLRRFGLRPICQAFFTETFHSVVGWRSGVGSAPLRSLQLLLRVLACALCLGVSSTSGRPVEREGSSPVDSCDRATSPAQAVSDPLLSLPRQPNRWILGFGKCHRFLYVAATWDDPNDDETSDDPNDDDDAWESVNGLHETTVPLTALLPETACFVKEPESRSEPLPSAPALPSPFHTLLRLRC